MTNTIDIDTWFSRHICQVITKFGRHIFLMYFGRYLAAIDAKSEV